MHVHTCTCIPHTQRYVSRTFTRCRKSCSFFTLLVLPSPMLQFCTHTLMYSARLLRLHWSCRCFLSDGFMLPRCPSVHHPQAPPVAPSLQKMPALRRLAAARHRPQLFGVSQYHHSDDHGVTCFRRNAATAARR